MRASHAVTTIARATGAVREAVRDVSPRLPAWIERFGRLGYAGKAIAYILVGLAALAVAIGAQKHPRGAPGALAILIDQPLGRIMLLIITVGIVGYAVWQLIAAITDGEHDGSDFGGIVTRVGKVIGFFVYGALAVQAVRLITKHPLDDTSAAQDWTARLMGTVFGRVTIVLVGCGMLIYGGYELYQSYRPNMRRHVDLSALDAHSAAFIIWLGRFGLAARGIVFGIIGVFLISAEIQYDPQRAAGLGQALGILEHRVYGQWLLGVVALGFVAYGLFELVNARWRRLSAG